MEISQKRKDERISELKELYRKILTPLFKDAPISPDAAMEAVYISPAFKDQAAKVIGYSEEEMQDFRSNFPKISYEARKVLKQGVKNMPHSPGGHPRLLTDEEKGRACKEVAKLLVEGVELSDALVRMSQKLSVSLRTMQRVWQERAKVARKATNSNR